MRTYVHVRACTMLRAHLRMCVYVCTCERFGKWSAHECRIGGQKTASIRLPVSAKITLISICGVFENPRAPEFNVAKLFVREECKRLR